MKGDPKGEGVGYKKWSGGNFFSEPDNSGGCDLGVGDVLMGVFYAGNEVSCLFVPSHHQKARCGETGYAGNEVSGLCILSWV